MVTREFGLDDVLPSTWNASGGDRGRHCPLPLYTESTQDWAHIPGRQALRPRTAGGSERPVPGPACPESHGLKEALQPPACWPLLGDMRRHLPVPTAAHSQPARAAPPVEMRANFAMPLRACRIGLRLPLQLTSCHSRHFSRSPTIHLLDPAETELALPQGLCLASALCWSALPSDPHLLASAERPSQIKPY